MKYALAPAGMLFAVGAMTLWGSLAMDPSSMWFGIGAMIAGVGMLIWGAIEDLVEKRKKKKGRLEDA